MQSLKYGYMIKKKNRTLSRLFHCLKTHLLALFGLLPTEITDFSTLSNTSTSVIPTLSYTEA